MEDQWNGGKPSYTYERIIESEEGFAVTITGKVLAHLKLQAGEEVLAILKEDELVIRKIPSGGMDGVPGELLQPLQETMTEYSPIMSDRNCRADLDGE